MQPRWDRPVVVTGAAGFIGRQVVAELRTRGRAVAAIDRRPTLKANLVRVVRCDLAVAGLEVAELLRDSAGVIHLAGRPGVRDASPTITADRTRDNVLTTSFVLSSTRPDTPVVVASSSSVYGGSSGPPSQETDPLRPRGGYAQSKVRTEALCAARISRGEPITVVRPFTVVGTGQRPDMALARWLRAAAEGQALTVFGSPERSRDLTDVRQVAAALVDLLEIGYAGPVNVATGTPVTLAAITDAVARAVGLDRAALELRPAPPEDPPATFADTTRLRRLLGRALPLDLDRVVEEAAASILRPGGDRRPHLVS